MADSKLSALTALAGSAVAAGDLLLVSDVSASASKSIRSDECLDGLLRVAAAASSVLGRTNDTVAVRFPTGTPGTDEVQISHDGTRGYIQSKDGVLRVLAVDGTIWLNVPVDGSEMTLGQGSVTIDRTSVRRLVLTDDSYQLSSTSGDWGVARAAAGGGAKITNGSTGGGTLTVPVSSANAFTVGANGTTNPVLNVITNVASQADGISVSGGAAGAGTTIAALSSGSNSPITVVPKGTGSFIVQLAGGTPGTDELQLNYTGSTALIRNMKAGGTFTLQGTQQTLSLTASGTFSFIPNISNGTSATFGLNTAGGQVNQVCWTTSATYLGFTKSIAVGVNGAASTPATILDGTWFTGGSATTTKPQLLVEPAGTTSTGWSTSGTGIGVNAASGFAGNVADFQIAATRIAAIASDGITMQGTRVTLRNTVNSAPVWVSHFAGGGFSTWKIDNGASAGALAIGGAITSTGAQNWLTVGGQGIPDAKSLAQFNQFYTDQKPVVIFAVASRTAQLLQFQTSASGSLGNVSGGCIGDVYADVATTSTDGTFDTLRTDTTVANALIANGDKIVFDYTLTTVNHPMGTNAFKVVFAGITIFNSGALAFDAAGTVRITGYITRKTETTARATISLAVAGSAANFAFSTTAYVSESTLTGLTLTGTNNLVLSASSAGADAASGDIKLTQAKIHIDGFGS